MRKLAVDRIEFESLQCWEDPCEERTTLARGDAVHVGRSGVVPGRPLGVSMNTRTPTHDPVVLAVEATIAGIVQLLRVRGLFDAAGFVEDSAGNAAYVACVSREARLDAIHGGRAERLAHMTASLRPDGKP